MKHLIALTTVFVCMNVIAAATNPTVNLEVLTTFNLVFKDAQNIRWASTAHYDEAVFKNNGVQTRAIFDNEGHLLQTIRYYKEDKLPSNILYNIQKKYCFDVWGVTEISNSEGTTYNVVLKCSKYWYSVKANTGGYVTLTSKRSRSDA